MKILLLSESQKLKDHLIREHQLIPLGVNDEIPKDNYDRIISFGYRKIIDVEKITCPIINLHISYLPYNRGAHPNFWSWWDETPKGVSIHFIDSGIDTGPVITRCQVQEWKDKDPTLQSSYLELVELIENLFIENSRYILDTLPHSSKLFNQRHLSSNYHRSKDLEEIWEYLPDGWDTKVSKIPKIKVDYHVDNVTDIRKKNNNLWMELLKLALNADPKKAKKILGQINDYDSQVTDNLKQLT